MCFFDGFHPSLLSRSAITFLNDPLLLILMVFFLLLFAYIQFEVVIGGFKHINWRCLEGRFSFRRDSDRCHQVDHPDGRIWREIEGRDLDDGSRGRLLEIEERYLRPSWNQVLCCRPLSPYWVKTESPRSSEDWNVISKWRSCHLRIKYTQRFTHHKTAEKEGSRIKPIELMLLQPIDRCCFSLKNYTQSIHG